ncbi:hypothetical protein LBMAG47_19420 [Planctomycetia bacterium]|nr:hypothetical protein LBMAG47_19420 [Planctomycetia bacterium]
MIPQIPHIEPPCQAATQGSTEDPDSPNVPPLASDTPLHFRKHGTGLNLPPGSHRMDGRSAARYCHKSCLDRVFFSNESRVSEPQCRGLIEQGSCRRDSFPADAKLEPSL